MLPVYNLQELCDEVSVLGNLLLKQDHHQRRDLPQGVITPHSPISLSPSSCVCMCVYSYVSVCVRVCMCGKVVRKEGNGQTQGRDSQTTVPKLQSKPDLFCRLSVVYYTALRASGRMCILEIASTRDDYSFATISEFRFCLHKPIYENSDVHTSFLVAWEAIR